MNTDYNLDMHTKAVQKSGAYYDTYHLKEWLTVQNCINILAKIIICLKNLQIYDIIKIIMDVYPKIVFGGNFS